MRKFLFGILFFVPLSMFAQKKISGKITDQNGSALSFANVQEKGASNTVSSDENGLYSITVQNDNAVLIFSSAEFVLQEVKVGNRSTINVQLLRSTNLDEVVVTAF
ncbi:MAG TPA: carboxypeptidase-like regulatory domain-containing protein, partial [Ferruginibacter sp.]|nr:carboxypeptidase-like regulatory domain-containing protein [Ferruginibacter sp.]